MSGTRRAYSCRQVEKDKVKVEVDYQGCVWLGFEGARGYKGEVFLSREDSLRLLEQMKQVEGVPQ